mgnify:FL=1
MPHKKHKKNKIKKLTDKQYSEYIAALRAEDEAKKQSGGQVPD